jgi:hypothetical protein
VFAHEFIIRIELDAPLFPVFLNDGFLVRALFFSADDFAALGLSASE